MTDMHTKKKLVEDLGETGVEFQKMVEWNVRQVPMGIRTGSFLGENLTCKDYGEFM